MTTRRTVLSGTVAAAAAAGLAEPRRARAAGAAQNVPVPIAVLPNGKVVMRVWINGTGPYLFFMDTGASASAIQSDLARKLGLKFTRGETVDGVGGEEIEGVYLAAEARFGPYLRQKGVAFGGMPNFKGAAAGLVAAGFLTTLPSVLDYGAREIRIYTHGAPDLSDFTPVKSYLSTEDPHASEMIYVYLTIDGVPLKLMVDTGADTHVFLYPSTVRAHGLWDKYGQGTSGKSRGITGAIDATRTVTMPDFELSDVTVPHLPVTMMDPASHNENNGADGLLGSRFLELFAMAVTQKGIALRPIARPAPAAPSSTAAQ